MLIRAELETPKQIDRVLDRQIFIRARQAGCAVDGVKRAHLELGAIGAAGDRRIDQRDCTIEVAVMIIADLGDDKYRMPGSDHALCDRKLDAVRRLGVVHIAWI